jgi:hypothetical protein
MEAVPQENRDMDGRLVGGDTIASGLAVTRPELWIAGFQALPEQCEVCHARGRYVTSPDNMAPGSRECHFEPDRRPHLEKRKAEQCVTAAQISSRI